MTDNNTMADSIPTEVGFLTDLMKLDLGKHSISINLLCFETKQINFMVLTISLFFFLP